MRRALLAAPAVFMTVLAVAIIAGTTTLRMWDGVTPGARFFPMGLALIALALSLALLAAQRQGADPAEPTLPDRVGAVRVGATAAALVGFGLCVPVIGMVPAVALFMLVLLLAVQRARVAPSLLATGIVTLGIEVIFVRGLSIPLPAPLF